MQPLSSPAIVLRTIEHGDNDKILTFFTLKHGKVSLIAKGAQKSVKRFSGTLELFSAIHLVWAASKNRGLPFLQEASIIHPYDHIRTSIRRTIHASCWCELVYQWMEEGQAQAALFHLLERLLEQLNSGAVSEEILHIAFQIRFMALNGFRPGLEQCNTCALPIDRMEGTDVAFQVKAGGILCPACGPRGPGYLRVSKGTVKILNWILNSPLAHLDRIRFSRRSVDEGLQLLNTFVPYHLGKETKSAQMLKHLQEG